MITGLHKTFTLPLQHKPPTRIVDGTDSWQSHWAAEILTLPLDGTDSWQSHWTAEILTWPLDGTYHPTVFRTAVSSPGLLTARLQQGYRVAQISYQGSKLHMPIGLHIYYPPGYGDHILLTRWLDSILPTRLLDSRLPFRLLNFTNQQIGHWTAQITHWAIEWHPLSTRLLDWTDFPSGLWTAHHLLT